MKLPDKKKERIQTIALILVGIIFVIYVSGRYALKPLLKKRSDQLTEIKDIRSKIEMAENVIHLIKLSQQANAEVVDKILSITETSHYVMKARLGNYFIGATELIEKSAKQTDIAIKSIKELNITAIPSLNKSSNPFQLYTIGINVECGMHDLVLLLKNIETSNPYLAISKIEIVGRPSKADEHSVSFNVQWPIWQDKDTVSRIIQSNRKH